MVYLDDIVIFADSFDSHLERLDAVLTALQSASLKLNPDKCTFVTSSMHFLGQLIDCHGIRPDPNKIAAVDRFPVPTDASSLKSFLGITSFYRLFIMSYARLADPLHQLLKKGVKWSWTKKEQRAMRDIQYALLLAPTHVCDDDVCQLQLKTGACKLGLGALLSRVELNGERPITFISRSTLPAEKNFCSNGVLGSILGPRETSPPSLRPAVYSTDGQYCLKMVTFEERRRGEIGPLDSVVARI